MINTLCRQFKSVSQSFLYFHLNCAATLTTVAIILSHLSDLREKIKCLSVQLMAPNSVVFTVKAVDVDGDMIHYCIDQSSVRPGLSTYFCPYPVHVFINFPFTCSVTPASSGLIYPTVEMCYWRSLLTTRPELNWS